MTAALTPDELDTLAPQIARHAARIRIVYGWLHPTGFSPRHGGQRGSADGGLNDLSRLVGTTQAARQKLEAASRLYAQACAALVGADRHLEELARMVDEGADRTLADPDARARLRPEEWPGIRDALAAKQRRVGRGDDLPADPAVVREFKARYEQVRKVWALEQGRKRAG